MNTTDLAHFCPAVLYELSKDACQKECEEEEHEHGDGNEDEGKGEYQAGADPPNFERTSHL